jgi:hypothetical protein
MGWGFGRIFTAVVTGGASEIIPAAHDATNDVITAGAGALGIDLDKSFGPGTPFAFLDPRRGGNVIADHIRNRRDGVDSSWRDGREFFASVGDIFETGGSVASWDRLRGSLVGRPLIDGRDAISGIGTLLGNEGVSRGLTDREKTVLRAVFGDSIDLDAVRIKEGNGGFFSIPFNTGQTDSDRAFTSGNTIYMKKNRGDEEFMQTLVHEMVHVWQYQHNGGAYQANSLDQQKIHGQHDAYDWRPAMVDGKAWGDLNPEQQAHLIEDAWASGILTDPSATSSKIRGYEYIDANVAAYMRKAWEELKAGNGYTSGR